MQMSVSIFSGTSVEKMQYASIHLEVTTVIVTEGSNQLTISHKLMESNAKVKRA